MRRSERRRRGLVEPQESLERLLEGNRRFVAGTTSGRARATLTRESRARLAQGQSPLATVVSCSDSRVPAEHVFDQGLGDLFIVRNAGTAVAAAALASIEFAVAKLRTKLILVLAHESCGAFRAVAEAASGIQPPSAALEHLVTLLRPSFDAAGTQGSLEERCDRAAQNHAVAVAREICASPVVAPLVASGEVLVAPAFFELVSGTVRVLETPVAPLAVPLPS